MSNTKVELTEVAYGFIYFGKWEESLSYNDLGVFKGYVSFEPILYAWEWNE